MQCLLLSVTLKGTRLRIHTQLSLLINITSETAGYIGSGG